MSEVVLRSIKLGVPVAEASQTVNYVIWQSILFIRSAAIILVIGLGELLLNRSPQLFTLLFRSLHVAPKEIRIFDIRTSGGSDEETVPGLSHSILNNYKWILRTAFLTAVCYVWEATVIDNRELGVQNVYHWNSVVMNCAQGWHCYAFQGWDQKNAKLANSHRFQSAYFKWNLAEVCQKMLTYDWTNEDVSALLEKYKHQQGRMTCYRAKTPSLLEVISGLAIAMTIIGFIVIFFETLTFHLLRNSKRRIVNLQNFTILILGLLILVWCYVIIEEALTAISPSISKLLIIVAPIILGHSM